MACAGVACASAGDGPGHKAPPPVDASVLRDASGLGPFCDLPGSVVWSGGRPAIVAGGPKLPDMTWLNLPDGFCAHYFGNVGNAAAPLRARREICSSPRRPRRRRRRAGGQGAIVVLPDDDLDGVADTPVTFQGSLGSTQGLLFDDGYFYYQDGTRRSCGCPTPTGDRAPPAAAAQSRRHHGLHLVGLHWPKTLDIADDGTIYVGNGGDQGEACDPAAPVPRRHPPASTARPADGSSIAKGFRNPIAVRCAQGPQTPASRLELALDYSAGPGGREKLVPIHARATTGASPAAPRKNLPYADSRRHRLHRRRRRDDLVPHRRHAVRPRLRAGRVAGALEVPRLRGAPRVGRELARLADRGDRDRPQDRAAGLVVRSRRGTSFTDFATGWETARALPCRHRSKPPRARHDAGVRAGRTPLRRQRHQRRHLLGGARTRPTRAATTRTRRRRAMRAWFNKPSSFDVSLRHGDVCSPFGSVIGVHGDVSDGRDDSHTSASPTAVVASTCEAPWRCEPNVARASEVPYARCD